MLCFWNYASYGSVVTWFLHINIYAFVAFDFGMFRLLSITIDTFMYPQICVIATLVSFLNRHILILLILLLVLFFSPDPLQQQGNVLTLCSKCSPNGLSLWPFLFSFLFWFSCGKLINALTHQQNIEPMECDNQKRKMVCTAQNCSLEHGQYFFRENRTIKDFQHHCCLHKKWVS